MDHGDHVDLIRDGITGSAWGDFGAGGGAFTLALAEVLGPSGSIYAIDRDAGALRANARAMRERFPLLRVQYDEADFTSALALPELDGIVMANSLHFQRDAGAVVRHVRGYLKPGGRIVLVEYSIERGNWAVPHPVAYSAWQRLAASAGFDHTELLARRPSRFLKEIYSAVSW